MKALIIGGGAVSEMFHIPAAIKLCSAENVYVAESSEVQRNKLMKNVKSIKVIENYASFLPQASCVIIATPPHTHIDIMRKCVEYGIPFLCEKPIALPAESESVQQIIETSLAKNITAGVCHTYRFFPNRLEARNLILAGFFGTSPEIDILEGDPTTWSPVTGYNFRRELTPGGVLLDGGIHSLDFLVWCLGQPATINYFDDSLGGLESNARLSLQYASAAKANFRISRTCSLPNTIRVSGAGHTAEFGIFDFGTLTLDQKSFSVLDKYPTEASDWANLAETQLADFLTAIENKGSPRCTLGEAVQSVKIIENCYHIKSQRPLPAVLPLPGLTF